MITNTNPDTGFRYGVISGNSLDPDLLNDLYYGPGARNLDEEAAAEALREELKITAAERGFSEGDAERWIEREFDERSQFIQIDEPTIEGEYEGVKYLISHLGGAPLVWILQGPEGVANRLCSPCVPNAADLDGGFILGTEMIEDVDYSHHYACYCPPRDWLAAQV